MSEEANLWKKFVEQQLQERDGEIIDEDVFAEGATPIDTDIAAVRIMLDGINPRAATPEQRAQILKLLRSHLARFT